MSTVLDLSGFGVAFHERVVLASVDLTVAPTRVTTLMGPTAGGKSTLARAIAGLIEAQPAARTWGSALYRGAALHAENRPVLVQQRARLLSQPLRQSLAAALPNRGALTRAEQERVIVAHLLRCGLDELAASFDVDGVDLEVAQQRCLAIAGALLADPALLIVDEASADLDEAGAEAVLALITHVAEARAVLFITHKRSHAERLGGDVALLAGGRIQERGETRAFLRAPTTEVGQHFVRTGGSRLPNPSARPEELADDVAPPPALPRAAAASMRKASGPRSFHWLERGRIGGVPRPGIVAELDHDLDALRAIGVDVLLTLEEQRFIDERDLARFGIESVFFPIVDMGAPSLDEMRALCASLAQRLEEGRVVAAHCRAGMGRTGTVLVAFAIWRGATSTEALLAARAINPRWVQSDEQLTFLHQFHEHLARERGNHNQARASRASQE